MFDGDCKFNEMCFPGGYCRKSPKVEKIPARRLKPVPKPVFKPEPVFEPISEPKPVFKPVPDPKPVFKPVPDPKPVFKPVPDPKPSSTPDSSNGSSRQVLGMNNVFLLIGTAMVLLVLAFIIWKVIKSKRARAEAQQRAIASQMHAMIPTQHTPSAPFIPYQPAYPDFGQSSLPAYSPPVYQDVTRHSQEHDEKGSTYRYDNKGA
jgi:hypothetical protein